MSDIKSYNDGDDRDHLSNEWLNYETRPNVNPIIQQSPTSQNAEKTGTFS
jgi:hypothetical protein